jgi:hypothetical protein
MSRSSETLNLHRRRLRRSSRYLCAFPVSDADPIIRFRQYRKVLLNQKVLKVIMPEDQRFSSTFAAAGDKTSAAAFQELVL